MLTVMLVWCIDMLYHVKFIFKVKLSQNSLTPHSHLVKVQFGGQTTYCLLLFLEHSTSEVREAKIHMAALN